MYENPLPVPTAFDEQALLQFTRRLLNSPEGEKEASAPLNADIQAAPATAERAWLLSKLE